MTGADINKYLLAKGLNQEAFADKVDIKQSAVSRWISQNTKLRNGSITKLLNAYPDFNEVIGNRSGIKTVDAPKYDKILEHKIGKVNVLDVNTLEEFMNSDTKPLGEIDVSDFVDATGGLIVKGDAMGGQMTLNGGDLVAHKEWHPRTYFAYGNIYVVFTRDHMFVRYLKKHIEKDYVLLVAKNDFYDDIDLPVSDIRRLFVVKAGIVLPS